MCPGKSRTSLVMAHKKQIWASFSCLPLHSFLSSPLSCSPLLSSLLPPLSAALCQSVHTQTHRSRHTLFSPVASRNLPPTCSPLTRTRSEWQIANFYTAGNRLVTPPFCSPLLTLSLSLHLLISLGHANNLPSLQRQSVLRHRQAEAQP